MSEFKKGERVVVRGWLGNRYGGKHGKVLGEEPGGFLSPKRVKVKLDIQDEKNFSKEDLSHEELDQGDVVNEINKIEKLVKQVADKLPKPMNTELPCHLQYLKESLKPYDKNRAARESRYLASNLLDATVKPILGNSCSEVEISLDKINWWITRSQVVSL